jgi:hypothetical protein
VISVFSIIIFGSIAYMVSPLPRGLGHVGVAADTPSPASTPA